MEKKTARRPTIVAMAVLVIGFMQSQRSRL
jgi:hypothetical protein